MNGVSPLYPYGHDIFVMPIPTCKGLDKSGDAVTVVGFVGIGYGATSAIIVGSGGTALPAAPVVGGTGGLIGILGKGMNLLAKYGIGCTQ
jgi:hypothetical protein